MEILLLLYGHAHGILVLIANTQKPPLSTHADVSSRARGRNFNLHPYFVYVSSICAGSPEPLLLISGRGVSTKVSYNGLIHVFQAILKYPLNK